MERAYAEPNHNSGRRAFFGFSPEGARWDEGRATESLLKGWSPRSCTP
jgi:hypothetical protein